MRILLSLLLLWAPLLGNAQYNSKTGSNYFPSKISFYQFGVLTTVTKNFYFNGKVVSEYRLAPNEIDTLGKSESYFNSSGNILNAKLYNYKNGNIITSINSYDYNYINNNLSSYYVSTFNQTTKAWQLKNKIENIYNSRGIKIGQKFFEYSNSSKSWEMYSGDSTDYVYLNSNELKYITKSHFRNFFPYGQLFLGELWIKEYDSNGNLTNKKLYINNAVKEEYFDFIRDSKNEITEFKLKIYFDNDSSESFYKKTKFVSRINVQEDFEDIEKNKLLSTEIYVKKNGVYLKSTKYDSVYSDNLGSYIYDLSYFNKDSNKYILSWRYIKLFSPNGQLLENSEMSFSNTTNSWSYTDGEKYEYIYDSNNNLIEYIIRDAKTNNIDYRYVYSDFIFSSIDNKFASNDLIKVYPNPNTNGIFNISLELEDEEINEIKLINMQGKEMQPFQFQSILNIEGYPSGVYILKVITNKQVYQTKIQKN